MDRNSSLFFLGFGATVWLLFLLTLLHLFSPGIGILAALTLIPLLVLWRASIVHLGNYQDTAAWSLYFSSDQLVGNSLLYCFLGKATLGLIFLVLGIVWFRRIEHGANGDSSPFD